MPRPVEAIALYLAEIADKQLEIRTLTPQRNSQQLLLGFVTTPKPITALTSQTLTLQHQDTILQIYSPFDGNDQSFTFARWSLRSAPGNKLRFTLEQDWYTSFADKLSVALLGLLKPDDFRLLKLDQNSLNKRILLAPTAVGLDNRHLIFSLDSSSDRLIIFCGVVHFGKTSRRLRQKISSMLS